MLLSASLVAAPAEAIVAVVDDSGQRVSLQTPARRVISLAPSITEMLFAAGAGSSVVGAVEYSDFPDAAKRVPRVGNNGLLDMERIVALHPDLIIVWWHGGFEHQLAQLRSLGVPVYYSEPRKLADIPRSLIAFGELTGSEASARQYARTLSLGIDQLSLQYAEQRPVSVFYQVWDHPLLTIDGKHILSDAIRLCGGRNIFADLPALVPTIGMEAVIKADPEAIVTMKAATSDIDGLDIWRPWRHLRAVAGNNLIVLDADLMSRPSPRIVAGTSALCERLAFVRAKGAR